MCVCVLFLMLFKRSSNYPTQCNINGYPGQPLSRHSKKQIPVQCSLELWTLWTDFGCKSIDLSTLGKGTGTTIRDPAASLWGHRVWVSRSTQPPQNNYLRPFQQKRCSGEEDFGDPRSTNSFLKSPCLGNCQQAKLQKCTKFPRVATLGYKHAANNRIASGKYPPQLISNK